MKIFFFYFLSIRNGIKLEGYRFLILTKRLTEKQKEEIVKSFKSGTAIDLLSENFACTVPTIIRNLKKSLGDSKYKEFLDIGKSLEEKSRKKPNQNKDFLELNNDNKVSLAIVGDSSSPYVQGQIKFGTATQIDGTSSGGTVPTILKHGIAFAKNSGAYTYNGNTVQTDNTMNVANLTTKYTQLTIGGNPSKAHIKRV